MIDSPQTTIQRARIIQEKPFLKRLYTEWYEAIIKELPNQVKGQVLELGSGGGFLKECIPDLITSDCLNIPVFSIILDGGQLPFKPASLKGIVMIDVLHHLSSVQSFISEAYYCIKPKGVMVMIEPWVTPWSTLMYKYLHHEPFIPQAKEWDLPHRRPLSQANSALPWIIFHRDLKIFHQRFPQWEIREITLHTPFSYLLSGGVSLRISIPARIFTPCRLIEKALRPWMGFWGMFATIVLIKKTAQALP